MAFRMSSTENSDLGDGYTQEEYLRIMHEFVTDGDDLFASEAPLCEPDDDTSTTIPEAGGHDRGLVQETSDVIPSETSGHSGGDISDDHDALYHANADDQQPHVPPNAFGAFGDMYPSAPTGWGDDLDVSYLDMYRSSQPSAFEPIAFDLYRDAAPRTPLGRHDSGMFPSRGSQQDSSGSQTLPPSWSQDQFDCSARPVPQPLQQSPGYSTFRGNYDGVAQILARTSNDPSPYAAAAPRSNANSQPQRHTYPTEPRVQPQPTFRRPTAPPVAEEVRDEEGSLEGRGLEEVDGNQELTTAKKTEKSQKASEGKRGMHRGSTRVNTNGDLEWLATADSEGVLAVRHDDIRPQLIAIAEAERVALGVQYEHPDEPGPGRCNVTSFYNKHIRWGPERESRPDILFAWEEDKVENPRPQCPGFMYWRENGIKYVVLDPYDNPIKDWDIPSTIASNIPGYKLEAMRRHNMSLGHKDFWARMPSRINIGTESQPIWEPLGHPNSVVNMPMERFRFNAGLCSWTARRQTLTIKEGLSKLYGNKLRNNSVKAFGRDLTIKEINEIKKGNKAKFPIMGDVVPTTSRTTRKPKSKGAASYTTAKSGAKRVKTQSRKRKHSMEDGEDESSEEDAQTQVRPRKRARSGRQEDSIAAEVDDLVMFEQSPAIIDEDDLHRRYPLRSTRKGPKFSKRTEQKEESSSESSTDKDYEDYDDVARQQYAPSSTRKVAKASASLERSSNESSADGEGDYVTTWVEGDGRPGSRESSVETDDEGTETPRVPFRRIPRRGDVGGKSKGPSWESPTAESGEVDHRKTVVPLSINGRIQYATYEGLISNEPLPRASDLGTVPSQASETDGEFLPPNGSDLPRPHPLESVRNRTMSEDRDPEEEETTLKTNRKRETELLEDEEAEARAPPTKRLCTEQQVSPLLESATRDATSDYSPQAFSQPISPPKADQVGKAPPRTQARASQIQEQRLDAEWAQIFEQSFRDAGYKSVNYSDVSPVTDEEVHSLIDALLPTREIYLAWTGEPAPRTDPQQSYRVQFDEIYYAFQLWWAEHRSDEPLPILAGVMHWGRSVDDWDPPSKDSIYYEAFKNGYRVRRGHLPDWPGPMLEDAFRMGY